MSKGHNSFFKKIWSVGVILGASVAIVSPFIFFNQNKEPTETQIEGEIILEENLSDQKIIDMLESAPNPKLKTESNQDKQENQKTNQNKKQSDNTDSSTQNKPDQQNSNTQNQSQNQTNNQAQDKTKDSKDLTQENKDKEQSKLNKESKDQKETQAKAEQDSKQNKEQNSANKDNKQDPNNKDQESKAENTTDGADQNLMQALSSDPDKLLEEEVGEQNTNEQAEVAQNQETDNKQTLAQKVSNLTAKRTEQDKERYEQEQALRKEYVNATVEEIANNSRIYLPPMFSSRAIVVYFSPTIEVEQDKSIQPKEQFDSTTGATLIKNEELLKQQLTKELEEKIKDPNKKINGVAFVAKTLANETQASSFNISTVIRYPHQVDQLYKFALNELKQKQRPELTDDMILDSSKFDCIYICYPNWWGDLPAAVYSFFDKFDLSGKTIVPICINDGDGFSNTIETIASLEPNASIYYNGLNINFKEFKEPQQIRLKLRSWITHITQELN